MAQAFCCRTSWQQKLHVTVIPAEDGVIYSIALESGKDYNRAGIPVGADAVLLQHRPGSLDRGLGFAVFSRFTQSTRVCGV
jgi:hypothetical protein